ncbi:Rqc2 family fibronectin-binding protein [Fenollaria massiliensis]|uniref:Rqc2 homolog RqcH n=1 Tax=Fenollaria massiliensis TaxID=938288 RepID=A0A9E7DKU6_9FIRM|nr:NFACT RNA binding domain-containing protein [Fenollaria massiliensis]UQK59627.1 NFACT family protein [Fenollaria massiliensis]
MSFDAIVTRALTDEFNNNYIGARVDKIYQTEKDEIMINMRSKDGSFKVLVSASSNNPRFYVSKISKENPSEAPLFSMILRKNLSGSKLVKVEQFGFDRAAQFVFSGYNEFHEEALYYLVVEIMGKYSNIVLCNENHKVIDAIKRVSNVMSSKREIEPGLIYERPPVFDRVSPINANEEDLKNMMTNNADLELRDFLMRSFLGLSTEIANKIIFDAAIDDKNLLKNLDENDTNKFISSFIKTFEEVKEKNYSFNIYKLSERKSAYNAINLNQYASLEKENFSSISELLDKYYYEKDQKDRIAQRSQNMRHTISANLKRAKNKLQKQKEEMLESANREAYKVYADLISSNIHKISKGLKEIKLENFYDNMNEISVPLDQKLSAVQNAQKYYKRYQKMKQREIVLEKQIENTEDEINYLELVTDAIDRTDDVKNLDEIYFELIKNNYIKKDKKIKNKPKKIAIHSIDYDDTSKVYYGKNNLQNEYITFKVADKNDVWMHVKGFPGSHVVIKCDGYPSDELLVFAAEIAAKNSKAKDSNKVDVDFTTRKNVKKHPSGKTGLVNYVNFKTITVDL